MRTGMPQLLIEHKHGPHKPQPRQKRTPQIRPHLRRLLPAVFRFPHSLAMGQVDTELGLVCLRHLCDRGASSANGARPRLQGLDEDRPRAGLDQHPHYPRLGLLRHVRADRAVLQDY